MPEGLKVFVDDWEAITGNSQVRHTLARCIRLSHSLDLSATRFVARMAYGIENVVGYVPSDGTCPFCFPLSRGCISFRKHGVEKTGTLDFLKECE